MIELLLHKGARVDLRALIDRGPAQTLHRIYLPVEVAIANNDGDILDVLLAERSSTIDIFSWQDLIAAAIRCDNPSFVDRLLASRNKARFDIPFFDLSNLEETRTSSSKRPLLIEAVCNASDLNRMVSVLLQWGESIPETHSWLDHRFSAIQKEKKRQLDGVNFSCFPLSNILKEQIVPIPTRLASCMHLTSTEWVSSQSPKIVICNSVNFQGDDAQLSSQDNGLLKYLSWT